MKSILLYRPSCRQYLPFKAVSLTPFYYDWKYRVKVSAKSVFNPINVSFGFILYIFVAKTYYIEAAIAVL